jgi:hypothetical protein
MLTAPAAATPRWKLCVPTDPTNPTSPATNLIVPIHSRYFDRTGCGYIKVEDLRRLMHALGAGLPHRLVKELVAVAAEGGSSRWRGERVYYRDLTDKEILKTAADGAKEALAA